jgi:hypothetical protein
MIAEIDDGRVVSRTRKVKKFNKGKRTFGYLIRAVLIALVAGRILRGIRFVQFHGDPLDVCRMA